MGPTMGRERPMALTVSDYIDVRQRAKELGLKEPSVAVFLPRNFMDVATKGELVYEDSLPDVKALFREAGIEFGKLECDDTKPILVKENSFDWILPTVFFTVAAYRANPDIFKTIVAKVWEHSKVVFTAVTGRSRIKWNVIIEYDGMKRTKMVSFDGAAEQFPQIREFIEKIAKDPETKHGAQRQGKSSQETKDSSKKPSASRKKKH
jgi:hypothetical protein